MITILLEKIKTQLEALKTTINNKTFGEPYWCAQPVKVGKWHDGRDIYKHSVILHFPDSATSYEYTIPVVNASLIAVDPKSLYSYYENLEYHYFRNFGLWVYNYSNTVPYIDNNYQGGSTFKIKCQNRLDGTLYFTYYFIIGNYYEED